jgi:uncharacterized protein YjbI with pentapeptide repeats
VSNDAVGLERLLLTDFGEEFGEEFDTVAVQALALMGAKDSFGRAPGDAEFMRPVMQPWGAMDRAKLVLGEAEALDGAVAAGLLGRLTEGGEGSRFGRWVKGAAPSGADTGDAGDAGEGAVASAGDTVAAAARVVLVTALLARATSGEAPEKVAMLKQLEGARLQKAYLCEAQLQKADFYNAELQGANLSNAQLQEANLCHARLQKADLRDAQLQKAILSMAKLQEADLYNAQLQGAKLNEAQLQGAKLAGAQLHKADLLSAQLQKANLYEAQFQKAVLRDAQLQKADLSEANLVGVRAFEANFTGARLQNAIVGAEPDQDTKATNFYEVCAPAPCIRSLRSYYFGNTDVCWGGGPAVRQPSPTRTARAPSSSPSTSGAPH